ncbi:hypothetical protein B932_3196 [Gluconobacter oxydans H24]|nr:hypothetical protein B932_3196 [Gluconobacter oxydans H24]
MNHDLKSFVLFHHPFFTPIVWFFSGYIFILYPYFEMKNILYGFYV